MDFGLFTPQRRCMYPRSEEGMIGILAIFYPFSQFCEINTSLLSLQKQPNTAPNLFQRRVEYGEYDRVGNPRRTQISRFELFELILLLKLDKQFPVEQFETTASQSTVPSPPLTRPMYSAVAAMNILLRSTWMLTFMDDTKAFVEI